MREREGREMERESRERERRERDGEREEGERQTAGEMVLFQGGWQAAALACRPYPGVLVTLNLRVPVPVFPTAAPRPRAWLST